jgi:hypothetical protein
MRAYSPALPVSPGVTVTCASPENPRTLAAAGLTSIIRPCTKGPRSLMVTTTKRPLLLFVTFTFRADRQGAVRGRESFGSQLLASSSPIAAFRGVDRGNTGLICCKR